MHLPLALHQLLAFVGGVTTTTVKGSTKSSGSSYVTLLVFLALIAGVYFFFLRPRTQRMRQQQQAARSLGVGDEVMSAGGIYGTVVALDDNEVEVEVAPGVVLTFIRRAISLRQAPPAAGPARGAAGGWGRAAGGSRPDPDPPGVVDDPWDRAPDGPGDRAGELDGLGDRAGAPDGPGDRAGEPNGPGKDAGPAAGGSGRAPGPSGSGEHQPGD
jgi:preprotein translocase subunit YajC